MSKIVVYGLSTEGYGLASLLAKNNTNVSIIDDSTATPIPMNAEIATTYPDILSFKEDEPLLSTESINNSLKDCQYLFFTPTIRMKDLERKPEITTKFKNAISSIAKNTSVIYCHPTGFGGNNDNLSLLEYVTGYEVGKTVNYYYMPLESVNLLPKHIGSFDAKQNDELLKLLNLNDDQAINTVSLSISETLYALSILDKFAKICNCLEVCKILFEDKIDPTILPSSISDLFLDDIVTLIHDLRLLDSSSEENNTLTRMINSNIRTIKGYIKYLTDSIKLILKKYNLKPGKTTIAISWKFDEYEMRGDKMEMLEFLITKLHDTIGNVELYNDKSHNIFHTDNTTVILTCSNNDYSLVKKNKNNSERIVIRANPVIYDEKIIVSD